MDDNEGRNRMAYVRDLRRFPRPSTVLLTGTGRLSLAMEGCYSADLEDPVVNS